MNKKIILASLIAMSTYTPQADAIMSELLEHGNWINHLMNFGTDAYHAWQRLNSTYLLDQAILDGDIDAVKKALDAGANPNWQNIDATGHVWSRPFICAAVERSESEIIKLLLKAGANPNIVDRGMPIFYLTVLSQNTECIDAFIDNSALDPNQGTTQTPLHQIIVQTINTGSDAHAQIARKLLYHPNINPNRQNAHGQTPLALFLSLVGNPADTPNITDGMAHLFATFAHHPLVDLSTVAPFFAQHPELRMSLTRFCPSDAGDAS